MIRKSCRAFSTNSIVPGIMGMFVFAIACAGSSGPTLVPVETTQEAIALNHSGVDTILVTTILRVGSQRVSFLLAGPDGIIKMPVAQVSPVFLGGNTGEQRFNSKEASFHLWPYGVRGAYSTELDFPVAGDWRLDIFAMDGESSIEASLIVAVLDESAIPDIGELPPITANKTLATVGKLENLTTDYTPDPDLYQISVDHAIGTDLPTVVVFATPAFCTSPTCGPQVDAVSELKEIHRQKANFIHVEFYDNPSEIQGDLSRAELVSHAGDWGFTTIPDWFNESWVFVLDSDGRIRQRFEGFTTVAELEATLQAVMVE